VLFLGYTRIYTHMEYEGRSLGGYLPYSLHIELLAVFCCRAWGRNMGARTVLSCKSALYSHAASI